MKWNKEKVLEYLSIGGQISELARKFNVSRNTIYYYIKKDKDLQKVITTYKKQYEKAFKALK